MSPSVREAIPQTPSDGLVGPIVQNTSDNPNSPEDPVTPATVIPPPVATGLPIEIWNTILPQACDLRGRTAAAISQVSRYFYEAIKPYRFGASLVIYGESRIRAFHEAMKVMPPDIPRAKHLYIALIPDVDVVHTDPVCDAVIDGRIHDRDLTPTEDDQRARQNKSLSINGMCPQEYNTIQYCDVAGIIFHHRETLQTLTYLTTTGYIGFGVFGHLPSLKELTVVCLRYKATFYEVHHSKHPRQTQFPQLARLHLSYFDLEPLFRHDEFRRVAPKLTHLRISGRKCYPELEKLHPDTKLLVQMILMSSQEQQVLVPYMRRVLLNQPERITLLEPGHREEWRYGFFNALEDWLDVSTGGNVFWGNEDRQVVTIDELAAR